MLSCKLFRKSTAGNTILHSFSFHPRPLVESIPYGQYLCIKRNCSDHLLYILKERPTTLNVIYLKGAIATKAWKRHLIVLMQTADTISFFQRRSNLLMNVKELLLPILMIISNWDRFAQSNLPSCQYLFALLLCRRPCRRLRERPPLCQGDAVYTHWRRRWSAYPVSLMALLITWCLCSDLVQFE